MGSGSEKVNPVKRGFLVWRGFGHCMEIQGGGGEKNKISRFLPSEVKRRQGRPK